MKKMNFTSQLLRVGSLMMLFLTLAVTLSAQGNPCLEKVTVYLDPATCSRTLVVSDVRTDGAGTLSIRKLTTAGAQDFVAGYNNGVYTGSSIIFGRNDIGSEFEIMSMNGASMCFHYVTVGDQDRPILPRIGTSTIKCTVLVNGKIPGPSVLGSWKGASGKGQVKNPLGNQIFVADDCSDFTQSWEDEYGPITCVPGACDYQTVTRHWLLKDIFGNATTIDQIIFVERPKITIPGVLNPAGEYVIDLFNCSVDASAAGAPVLDYCLLTDEAIVYGKDYCGRSVEKISETRMNLCPGSYMLMRSYKVRECDNTFKIINQVVNVWDRTTPLVQFKYNDYLRVKESMCYNMNGMELTEFVYKTVVTPIDLKFGNQQIDGVAPANASYSLKITPLVNSISCNTASISLDYTVSDPTL